MLEFQLKSEYIELVKLLKLLGLAETGGHAKILVEEGEVSLNGTREFRKRAKLRKGDIVSIFDKKIRII
ncbi:RNA-binding S4 domain-containing protein [Maribellus comscasis]|uniref:RNA-binding S4 domain-containing protein n=1 Tax=Maribellus comscasis TaxID=2681766 RepID=A0A6I6JTK9_9BACT|nr:RNA-binding S4 domain-containing protein [Maribellus comscasis]QGY44569.1 RNA-binding S4 domain-containing protein [Maribellus comscasis]